ncbi:MAG: 2Fe-2S iron-sulfur cluster binding domain-containing protein [Rhodospirillaceae bacterium]|jgi:ferredoxin, 2Fe-2S|nr:2Fe-2S iron-sulfur cluster binding domain-containing protein [Rhodospirillaceae bacterium]MBT6138739.1 2Fe-2S iron-sulfur cluster binding domain-containing protein [Rhodospirillaceae bacterium]
MAKMTFIGRDGLPQEVEAPIGLTLLQIARDNDVQIEGACEGCLACATCHVYVREDFYDKLPAPEQDEEDMLDLAFLLKPTSRLGCQIVMTEALDGLVVRLPPDGGGW